MYPRAARGGRPEGTATDGEHRPVACSSYRRGPPGVRSGRYASDRVVSSTLADRRRSDSLAVTGAMYLTRGAAERKTFCSGRQAGHGRLRRVAPGPNRRPAPGRGRGRDRPLSGRPARRRVRLEDLDRPLRRVRGRRRAPVRVAGVLDSARSGVVVSAIQGRDYARIYVKELDRGRAPIALSPEELEAVERAMAPERAYWPSEKMTG